MNATDLFPTIPSKKATPKKIITMEFDDRDAAMDWMDTNQLGRRNLSPVDLKLALGRRYNRSKKANGERGAEKLDQNEPAFTSTAAKLATQHGVSFTRRNALTNQNALRINPDAVVGIAGVGVVRNLFESPKIERDRSHEYHPCNSISHTLA